jgi:hypothetical protein
MKTPRIYLDTSVLGGCFEAEFAARSNGLLDDFRGGRFIPVLSDLLEAELNLAPESVRKVHGELLGLSAERAIVSPEALSLLSAYEAHSVLGPRYAPTCSTSLSPRWPTPTCW